MRTTNRAVRWLLGGVLALLVGGCQGAVVDGPHCALLDGDATCAALGGQLPFCSAGCLNSPHGNGCVATRPADDCYSPCGGGLTADQLSECPVATGEDSGSTSLSSSSGLSSSGETSAADGTATDTAPQCEIDAQCEAPTGSCVAGECVACDDAPRPDLACEALDASHPICADGVCVACTAGRREACEGDTPVCDVATNTCVGCLRHADCPMSACHIEQGACLPPDRVWWVDADGSDCGTATGTERAPYCTIAAALANIGAGEMGTLIVAERADSLPYAEALTISAGRVVAVLAEAGDVPRFAGTGVGSPVTVTGGAVAYLDTGRVDGSVDAEAVAVVGSVLHMTGWRIVQNSGGGISLSNGAQLRVDTTAIGANGSALVDAQGLRATDSVFALNYVTMAGNDSSTVASIRCTGATTAEVRNSIVVGLDGDSIECADLSVRDSAVDSLLAGEGLVLLDMFEAGWFQAPGAGDFHLVPGHPFGDVARWHPGDPPLDIDGELRPQSPDAPDVAGFDR